MTTVPDRAESGARDPWSWGLLAVVLVTSFLSLPALRYDGDVNAWEMEAESLVHRGTLAVRASVAESLPRSAPYFMFNPETGHWYSKYGIGNTLIYAAPLAFERFVLGRTQLDPPGEIFGKTAGPYHVTRRLGLFNGFNLLLTLWLASALYRLARLYSPSPSTAAGFVLCCLYSTFLWNYTRAHSSQLYQVLFFSLMILHGIRFIRGETARHALCLLWCALSLAALCSVKLVFLPLVAVVGVVLLLVGWDGRANPLPVVRANLRAHFTTYARQAIVPLLALGVLLLWVNDVKFGSPFKLGYERETDLFGGRWSESIPAYLFAPRFSIFIHFPVLAIALLGLPRMARRAGHEAALVWSCFLSMFFIYSSYTYWTAEASYGPRYLIFALPALSLPIVGVLDRLRSATPSWQRTAATAILALVIAGSIYAQVLVNRLEFHTFFRLRQQFQRMDRADPALQAYLRNTNTAVFNRDFIRYRDEGEPPLPLRRLASRVGQERYRNIEASVRAHLDSNHLFF